MPATMMTVSSYPPLNVQVHTPRLSLLGATDELLERLVPTVRRGVVTAAPWPFDDPMSLYKDSPDREWAWLRGVWAGRGKVSDSFWRLYFVVAVDDEPVGAESAAFVDNHASNRVSEAVGYTPNGVCWDTRRGDAAELHRWS